MSAIKSETKTVTILVVEDDDLDFKAFQRALKNVRLANPVFRATDGIEALEMLRGENGRDKIDSPYMIMLDLSMPRMGGLEFLDEIRNDPELTGSIVFVLTSSASDYDVTEAYKRHIAGYITKGSPENGIEEAIKMIDHFWRVVEFP